ncbi:MAG: S8 family peptidase [Polyangiaceae bacterium]|nr:S8 family peptidase [Polyangiaceae bacterium]
MARDRAHILVRDRPNADAYSPHPRTITPKAPPSPADPGGHAAALKQALLEAEATSQTRRDALGIQVAGATPGLYVRFDSQPNFRLKLDSLDARGAGIELVSVTHSGDTEHATVFVPDGKIGHFIKRFEEYASQRTKKGEPSHKDLVESIARLQLATLRALWTDSAEEYPEEHESLWWEVWLRASDGSEVQRLSNFCEKLRLSVGEGRLTFPDRIVLLVKATPLQLSGSVDVLNDVAEVRRAKETADDFLKMTRGEIAEWAIDLAQRLDHADTGAPTVCILDTGINRGHPLLEGSLVETDMHAWKASWGVHDHDGHGTEMAGLALLGDLTAPLRSASRLPLRHGLESVKILPPKGANAPELYGAIMAEAAARVEIQGADRRRAFSLSITATDERDRGQPSSWSAAIDALAAGRSFDPTSKGLSYLSESTDGPHRLFVISAGNVDDIAINHLERSDLEAVHDPAQSWNALTVGACTNLDTLNPQDQTLRGWKPVALAGDLSPYSTTSVTFAKQWPVKPDVVFEGGNKVHDGKEALQHDALSVLTTHFKPQEKLVVPSWATSASTAQVARFAGILAADYPSMWPESIRALIVHSAEWTPRMREHLPLKAARGPLESLLLRRFGFGVPNLERARRSAKNALTLVVQDSVRPFEKTNLREMKVHDLPWPTDELLALGDAPVQMRVTLSYFIEPNPARRGWRNRHQYASHGLRFEVMRPTESGVEFRKRVNKLQLSEGEKKPPSTGDSDQWLLGPTLRHHGSLHSDIWSGTAVDLAGRGSIGVYPVSGWWKDQPSRDRSELGARYCLLVSIETPALDVDIYTPIAQQVGIPVVIQT